MRLAVLTTVLVALAAVPPARAGDATEPELAAAALSMEQAVKMAEQRYKARVVRAEAEHDGGRTVYVLRLLNESGRVWTVRVDAASGTVSQVRRIPCGYWS